METNNPQDKGRAHAALVSVLIARDTQESKTHKNPYRIGLFLEALERAEKQGDLREGLKACFEGSLLKALLKALDRV